MPYPKRRQGPKKGEIANRRSLTMILATAERYFGKSFESEATMSAATEADRSTSKQWQVLLFIHAVKSERQITLL